MIDHFIKLDDGVFHAIDTGPRGQGLPFIYIPGIAGVAEDGLFFADAFPNRRCISISMRGRGQSSTPEKSYSITQHSIDIAGILKYLEIKSKGFHLHGYSIAVMYCLSFLEQRILEPASLILGDHSAQVEKLPNSWSDTFSKMQINGKSILDNIRTHALKEIEADSTSESIIERLTASQWPTPTILLHGSSCSEFPSKIKKEDIQNYKLAFKHFECYQFQNSGHFFRDSERNSYLDILNGFLGRHDV